MKKIRLAQISPNLNAYSETFIQNHKKHFDADVKYYFGDALPIHLEGWGYLSPSFSSRIGQYINRLLKKRNERNLREDALVGSFKKQKIDIVFAEYGTTGAAVVNVCKKLKLPLIVNFHGFDASETHIIESYRDKYLEMFDYASKIIAVSKVMNQKLQSLGCPAEKIAYIPYGPDNVFFDVKPTYQEDSFLAVGRFVDKKAPYYTILAFQKVLQKHPEAKLYMVGDGPLLNACINLVRYHHLDGNVEFLGKTTHEEMLSYVKRAKAFVQHSITAQNGDMEGTPVAIIEMSAAALPILSTIHAGIPDVVLNGVTGMLVEEHDVDGMANNMRKILGEKDLSRKMGEAGRINIKKNYTIEIQMDQINSLIKNILSDHIHQ